MKRKPTRPRAKVWKMPQWMEQYRPYIHNTGGNSVEELMNNHTATPFENAPLAMICVAVKSQVSMLMHLHDDGLLGPPTAVPTHRAGHE